MEKIFKRIFITFLILMFAKAYIYADDDISEELFSFEEISTDLKHF